MSLPLRRKLDLEKVVEAAAQLADATGIEEVTMAALAKKLGIRSPSLYNHVNGLAGLHVQLAIYGLKLLSEMVQAATHNKSGDEAVHAVAAAYISFARVHPGLYELTIRAADPVDEEHTALSNQVLEMFIMMLSTYKLEHEQAIHALRGLRSILHGFASIEQKGGFGMPLSVEDSMKFVLQTYLDGLNR